MNEKPDLWTANDNERWRPDDPVESARADVSRRSSADEDAPIHILQRSLNSLSDEIRGRIGKCEQRLLDMNRKVRPFEPPTPEGSEYIVAYLDRWAADLNQWVEGLQLNAEPPESVLQAIKNEQLRLASVFDVLKMRVGYCEQRLRELEDCADEDGPPPVDGGDFARLARRVLALEQEICYWTNADAADIGGVVKLEIEDARKLIDWTRSCGPDEIQLILNRLEARIRS